MRPVFYTSATSVTRGYTGQGEARRYQVRILLQIRTIGPDSREKQNRTGQRSIDDLLLPDKTVIAMRNYAAVSSLFVFFNEALCREVFSVFAQTMLVSSPLRAFPNKTCELDRRVRLRSRCHHQKKRLNIQASLYRMLQLLSVTAFDRMPLIQRLHGRCVIKQKFLREVSSH